MNDIFSVHGRVAVVTGGLGQLGTQFTKTLAEAGAKVAIYSRRPFGDNELAEEFPGLVDRIRVYEASVTDKAALEIATEKLVADWGVPHILVNNAGIDSKPEGSVEQNAPFEVYPQKYWDGFAVCPRCSADQNRGEADCADPPLRQTNSGVPSFQRPCRPNEDRKRLTSPPFVQTIQG